MPVCYTCGKEVIVGPDEPGIRKKGRIYHLSCAPAGLLDDAVKEWDAIMARGIEYFVDKYLPDEAQAKGSKKDGQALIRRFALAGEKFKAEVGAGRAKKHSGRT